MSYASASDASPIIFFHSRKVGATPLKIKKKIMKA
jgi:hypothetical protein